jgi:hypothetical protein
MRFARTNAVKICSLTPFFQGKHGLVTTKIT